MPNQPLIDSLEAIQDLDEQNMLGGIESLADQVRHAWTEVSKVSNIDADAIDSVVVAGMGGSGLGADIVSSVFHEQLTKPVTLIRDYTLPGFVSQNTLVILASFSGTTEEILSTANQALTKNARVAVIAAGGELLDMATTHRWPHYAIKATQNPSPQSRIAIGYALVGMIGMLHHAGVVTISDTDIEDVITTILDVDQRCQVTSPTEANPAKTLAYSLLQKRPLLVVADFLAGAAHVSQNQLHENAKVLADYRVIPELNHHLMEGLKFPLSNTHDMACLFVQSTLYHPQNQKRLAVTAEVTDHQDIESIELTLKSESKLAQAFELIATMSYVSFYLAMLEGVHPAPLPHVEWFKTELKNR